MFPSPPHDLPKSALSGPLRALWLFLVGDGPLAARRLVLGVFLLD
jgi:hypothetical protein